MAGSCPAEAGNSPLLYARRVGASSSIESAARRASRRSCQGPRRRPRVLGGALSAGVFSQGFSELLDGAEPLFSCGREVGAKSRSCLVAVYWQNPQTEMLQTM